MRHDFNQTNYWIKRHERFANDPRSIGNVAKSHEENVKGDESVVRWVHQAAALLTKYKTVLDIGCGYGRVAPAFCEQGFLYHGVDVSPLAVLNARSAMKKYSNAYFEVADLSDWKPNQVYDLVCALFVFVHFVDDSEWSRLLNRALTWVAPGGALLLAESNFPDRVDQHVVHAKRRPLAEYGAILSDASFTLVHNFASEVAAHLPYGARRPCCFLAVRAHDS
jgi:SAM-dependent methyltransferase